MLSPSPKTSGPRVFWLIALGAVAGLLFDVALHRVFSFALQRQDQTWLLYAAARVLDGTPLYGSRLVETNPPLIIWLCTLPAWLAIHLHLQPLLVLDSLVTLLIVLSSAWSVRVLRVAGVLGGATATIVVFALLAVAETSMGVLEFAEREHIVVLLLMPYLLVSFFKPSRSAGVYERIALGIVAGVGCCIKPQYSLILLGTELFLAAWDRQLRRLWRPEVTAVMLTGVAYVAAVCYFTPRYFTEIVPMLRDTYPTYRGIHPVLWIVFHDPAYDLFFALVLVVWIVYRRTLRHPVAPVSLLVASASASIALALQHTGWPYQMVPRNAFLVAAGLWLAAELGASGARHLQPDKHLRIFSTAAAVVVLLPVALIATKRTLYGRSSGIPTLEQRVYARLPPGTTVYVLSTNFYNFSDVVHDHLRWGGRYVHLWMLPAIVLNEAAEAGGPPAAFPLPPARVQQLGSLLRSNVADDLQTFAPAVIFVEHCDPATHPCFGLEGRTFDTLAWFQRSPTFAAAWQNYHRQQIAADVDVYTFNPLAPSDASSHGVHVGSPSTTDTTLATLPIHQARTRRSFAKDGSGARDR